MLIDFVKCSDMALKIAPQHTAAPLYLGAETISLDANHIRMVKYASSSDKLFTRVAHQMDLVMKGMEENIRARWAPPGMYAYIYVTL